jgi:hypothetical protein
MAAVCKQPCLELANGVPTAQQLKGSFHEARCRQCIIECAVGAGVRLVDAERRCEDGQRAPEGRASSVAIGWDSFAGAREEDVCELECV